MYLEDYRLGIGAIIINKDYDSFYLFERIDFRDWFQFPEGGLDYADIFTKNGEKIKVKIKDNAVFSDKPHDILSVFVGAREITDDIIFSKFEISGKVFKITDTQIEIPPNIGYRFTIDNIDIVIHIKTCRTCLICDFYRVDENNRPIYENPKDGAFREIYEEVGLNFKELEFISETKDFISYDFNLNKVDAMQFFRARGQAKKFFLFRYLGESDPSFDFLKHSEQEFVSYIKVPIEDFLNKINLIPDFKVEMYRKAFKELLN